MELDYKVGDEYGLGANPFKTPPKEKVVSVNITGTLIIQDGDDDYINDQINKAIDDANTQCNDFTRFDYDYDLID